MRTFFCIPMASAHRASIASIAERIRAATSTRASWVRPENYHVTVRFLGEIDPMLTVDLDRIAGQVVGRLEPFTMTLDRVGAFPSTDRARVLWVGGETPVAFIELVRSLEERLRSIGFEPDRRGPEAHVTVARVKGRPDRGLVRTIEDLELEEPLVAQADRIVLMESRLTSSGAVYSPLFETPIGRG